VRDAGDRFYETKPVEVPPGWIVYTVNRCRR
jgi:hypothetical protein